MDKSKIMMITIIVLLAVLLGTITFVSVYAINLINANASVNTETEIDSSNGKEETKLKQEEMVLVKFNDQVRGIIPDSSYAVAFKVGVAIDVSDKKNKKEAEELQALLEDRDVVVYSIASEALLSHTADEYASDATVIKQKLSSEILERLQSEFASNLIVDVYLSGWVMG